MSIAAAATAVAPMLMCISLPHCGAFAERDAPGARGCLGNLSEVARNTISQFPIIIIMISWSLRARACAYVRCPYAWKRCAIAIESPHIYAGRRRRRLSWHRSQPVAAAVAAAASFIRRMGQNVRTHIRCALDICAYVRWNGFFGSKAGALVVLC